MGKKYRKHRILDPTAIETVSTCKEVCTQVTPWKKTFENEIACDTNGLIACSDACVQKESFCDKQMEDLPKSFKELIETGTLNILCNILSQYNQLKDFENLLRNISSGKIDPTNICWLLNIHLGRLISVNSTTQMRWNQEIVEFFSIVYILFGASAINVLRGPMHFSNLVMENVDRGKFNPATAKINLPIPSVTTLRSLSTGFPKEIPVGLVQHSLEIAEKCSREKNAQYVLSFDGKMVARGFKGESFGDIDLWGIEKPISVTSALKLLKHNISTCDKLKCQCKCGDLVLHISNLQSLLNQLSRRIRTLRSRINGEHYLRLKLVKMSQNQNLDSKQQYSYRMQLSFLNEQSARCDSSIGRALHLNQRIMRTLAMCRQNLDVFEENKVVQLSKQNNAYFLLDTENTRKYFNLELPENSNLIKQRSPEWFNLRKEAKVTGSTLYKALGLESLGHLKSHHYEFIKKRNPPEFPPEVKVRLQYGQENEKHVIATLVGGFLPALKPKCFAFMEVGPKLMTIKGEKNFIEVSADGLIRCLSSDNCNHNGILDQQKLIPVEAKTVYPDLSKPLEPHYKVPARYVPQCLAEMAAFDATSLWLLSYTQTSCSLLLLHFHDILWKEMIAIAHDLHGGEKPKVPVKLHPMTQTLRKMVNDYTDIHCTFLCEIPSFRGIEGVLRQSEFISPYSVCDIRDNPEVDCDDIEHQSESISFEGKPLFETIHNTLRQEAQEVLVFMISNHNCHHEEFIPYSLPLGYAMKGKHLNNSELRFLVNHCREKLLEKKIPVLCEVYDGQWQNLCMLSEEGSPLNELRLIKPTWQKVRKFTKEKCIQEITLLSKLKAVDLEEIAAGKRLEEGTLKYYNVEICKKSTHKLELSSTGGPAFSQPTIQHMKTATKDKYPELWNEQQNVSNEEENTTDDKKLCSKKVIGLRETERNLVHLLDTEIVAALEEEIGDLTEADGAEDSVVQEDRSKILLRLALKHSDIKLLAEILEDLKEYNTKKWGNYSSEQLYPTLLTSVVELNKNCTVPELSIIGKVMEHKTGRKFFISGAPKAVNLNNISKAFGAHEFMALPIRRENFKRKVKSLQMLSKEILMREDYKVTQLQVSLANAIHREKREKWINDCPINLIAYVPNIYSNHVLFPMFSYPEYNKKRKQIEHRTLDYTHILTNMKTHILTKGYDFCPKEHFQDLAHLKPDLLSRPLVFDNIDQQNAYSAIAMFSVQVQHFLEKRGHTESANFVQLVREWHSACDTRGIRADLRVTLLYNMYCFLTHDIDFNRFPFTLTGRYWRGMPLQTYEALLQNICTRIQLYDIAHNETYNNRAISTLANESFFSDMGRMDKESRAYPKACNIPKIFGRVVTLNYFKHMPEKTWFLTTTHKGTYPEHLAEIHNDLLNNQDGYYTNHFFDFPDERDSQRVRRSDISRGTQPLRFAGGVRKYHRVDESKILPEERAGVEAKAPPKYDATTGKLIYTFDT